MEVTVLAAFVFAALLAWVWLALLRGGFWLCDQRLPECGDPGNGWPAVTAVIPARDEAESIAESIRSLADQDYPGDLAIVLVDDNSSDGTAGAARKAEPSRRLDIVDGAPLADGWTGKLWAMHQGIARAADVSSDAQYILLTDADIAHGRDALRRLVAMAEANGLDLASLMVRLRCDSFWERWLIPAFVYFFQKLYPFRWVQSGKRPAAAGGCMLVRRSALDRIGGVESIRDCVIDDCALAAEIARNGRIWLGLAETSASIRGYDGLSGIWNMVARTAFVQLRHSYLQLSGTVLGMAFLYLLPPAGSITGFATGDAAAMAFGAAGCGLMAALYVPMLQLYRLAAWRSAFLPLVALIYTLMTVSSAWRHLCGRGGTWKGRSYEAPTPPSASPPEGR